MPIQLFYELCVSVSMWMRSPALQSLLSHSLTLDVEEPDQVEESWARFTLTLQLLFFRFILGVEAFFVLNKIYTVLLLCFSF
jgi:hypothetical protein